MESPENYAVIEQGIVANVIWVLPRIASEFGNVVLCTGQSVQPGDVYLDGTFYSAEESGEGV